MDYIYWIYGLLAFYTLFSIVIMLAVIFYQTYLKHVLVRQQTDKIKWMTYFQTNVIASEDDQAFIIDARTFRKLRQVKQLQQFTAAVATYLKGPHQAKIQEMVNANMPSWLDLGRYYARKSSVEKAYYAALCSRLPQISLDHQDKLIHLLLPFLDDPSIYCKENVLKALCNFGQAEPIIETLMILSEKNYYHNQRLVSDGLLTYTGDRLELIELLYKNLFCFSTDYQVAIINYFNLEPAAEILDKQLITLLEQADQQVDISCAVLRYYTKHPVQDYLPIFLTWLQTSEDQNSEWQSRSVAASTLARYPGPATEAALITALYSNYWYVRKNAAQALWTLQVPIERLSEVFASDDPYAKDQLVAHYGKQVTYVP